MTYKQMDREVKRGRASWTGSHSVKRGETNFWLLPDDPGLPVCKSEKPEKYWSDVL